MRTDIRKPIIVLTGGPCGGKTTLADELRHTDPRAQRWLILPESAPLLFRAGCSAREKNFQLAVVRTQLALEDACLEVARPEQVLLCHRGALDPLAYWLRNGWDKEEFFALAAQSREDYFGRYMGIIHLQTTALFAVDNYVAWPNAHRPETPEQAILIDELCARAWRDHPRYTYISNEGLDWAMKRQQAHDTIAKLLGL